MEARSTTIGWALEKERRRALITGGWEDAAPAKHILESAKAMVSPLRLGICVGGEVMLSSRARRWKEKVKPLSRQTVLLVFRILVILAGHIAKPARENEQMMALMSLPLLPRGVTVAAGVCFRLLRSEGGSCGYGGMLIYAYAVFSTNSC